MRVIAVSHVGSEEDIIEAFVRHHARFCDEMIILLHGSVDATGDILQKLKAEGYPIHLFHDETFGHVEIDHLDRLLKLAACDFGADWVIGLDADEFIGGAVDNSFLPPTQEGEPFFLRVPLRTYYPHADDRPDLLNPVERITHRLETELKIYKVIVPGWLARKEGARYTGGKHSLVLDGKKVSGRDIPNLWLGHFSLRTAGQYAVKLAGKQLQKFCHVASRGSEIGFYDMPYRLLREQGFTAFAESFRDLPISWHLQPRSGMTADPMPYLGAPLRYSALRRDEDSLIHLLLEFSEKLAHMARTNPENVPERAPGSQKFKLEISGAPSPERKTARNFVVEKGGQMIRIPVDVTPETTELHFNLVSDPGMVDLRQIKLISGDGLEILLGPDEIRSRLRVVSGGLLIWSYPGTACRLLISRYDLVFVIAGWDFQAIALPAELVLELRYDEQPLLPLILAPEVLNTLNFERNKLYAEIEERRLELAAIRRENEALRAQVSYELGSTIDFTSQGNSLIYQGAGWSWPEPWGTWTDGKRATLNVRFSQTPKSAVSMKIVAQALIHPAHPETRVEVSVNGVRLETWVLTSSEFSERRMKIPARELASGTCEIAFDIPDPASPAKLGLSDDRRELGLGVARVIFSA